MTPLYPQKLALTSPTGGGRSVGIVRSRTKATEFGVGDNGTTDSNCNIDFTIDPRTGSDIYLKCKYYIVTGVRKFRASDRLGERFV